MSVLVYIETENGGIKKSSMEAASYAAAMASAMGSEAHAVIVGACSNPADIGNYGVSKAMHVANGFDQFDAGQVTEAIAAAAEKCGASEIVLSQNYSGKAVGSRLSAKMKAGLIPGAVSLPNADGGFKVRKNVFSGKGIAEYQVNTDKKVVAINPNSYPITKTDGTASVEALDVSPSSRAVRVKEVKKLSDSIPLSEAELVVSAGRGLKGPENWGMIEEMAGILGAATACSRAVSDVDWRPHHEHVGQTGLTVRPNLYIAIAISGAIQHLAGVNSSKTIVVINKDPEAPFFKAADYGIVGDAFEVVPRLNEALKKYKASN